jgi:site-specific DNA-methyltransferase (adenine-specific)
VSGHSAEKDAGGLEVYYRDELVTLYKGDALDLLASMPDRDVDVVLTDPPYDDRTHSMARTNKGRGHGNRAIDFAHFTHEAQVSLFAELGRVTKRWVVSTLPTSAAFAFDLEPPPGLRCLRVGVWLKKTPMPQISADRPGMGWEPIVYLHRADEKPTWNGGGKAGNYFLSSVSGTGHPTSKPLSMVSDWVRQFSNPGDLVFDPFAGSGTTLRAAKDEGRRAIGVEIDEAYCELIAKRLSQETLFGGVA